MDAGATAVTLDLWHTLVYLDPEDEEAYMERQIETAVAVLAAAPPRREGAERSGDELRRVFEEEYAAAVAASQQGRSVPPAEQIERAGARVGRAVRSSDYLDGLRRLVAQTPFRLGPGAVEAVRALRTAGHRVAVISNTVGEPGATLRPMLREFGFDGPVQTFVFSDEHPWTKPDPAIFGEALARLGVPAARAVHVGDGWSDIEGARRAGMRGGVLFTGLQQYGHRYHQLFLPPGWASPETEHRIERLSELPPLVERLLA
ncbi:MAG TPA: HAD family hydrolase [Thermoplasmata archaeon]|nr:HAD family hydrolase [Thermoplasmata archaeon]